MAKCDQLTHLPFKGLSDNTSLIATFLSLRYVRVFAVAIPSVVCLSVVCNVGAPYSGVEAFGNISSPLCTLAIL